jgi:signal transduction histidine kinase
VDWISGSVRIWSTARIWRALALGLLGVPLGVAYCLVVIGFLLVAGIARIVAGVHPRQLWARFCLPVIRFEAGRLAAFGGAGFVVGVGSAAPGSAFGQSRSNVREPAVGRALGYLLLVLPLSILETSSIWLVARAVLGFVLPLHSWVSPRLQLGPVLGASVVGLAQVWVAPWVTVGMVWAHRWLARSLLSPSRDDQLAERVEALTESRARAMDAAVVERRRIERDLHDGAQQRLVALALSLGMARAKLDSDPAAAAELVAEAHEEAMRALAEIRDLARGIHPAVLTDRGLDAAVSALAGRCPVPVEIDVPRARLPEAVESTAYFFIAETLTNVARHSRASAAKVSASVDAGRLVIEVEDDGVGGASWAGGTGLRGLADRLAAYDGWLALRSPPGGPTVVSMQVPCE